MDYNNIDDDDVESLRLAALMTCKRKSKNQKNTNNILPTNSSAYSNISNRNNRSRFCSSNRPYKSTYINDGSLRAAHSNNNLIAIIPTDNEGDSLPENYHCKIKEDNKICTKVSGGTETNDANNCEKTKEKVSTKFSRLENESGSDESSGGSAEKEDNVDSDDGDVLLLGQQDEDLDDLDKLMDIMEAEIACEVAKPSKKENKKLKQCTKSKKEKSFEAESNFKNIFKGENQKTVHSKDSDDYKMLPKAHLPSKSPTPLIKKSISPYNELCKGSLPPKSLRRKSSTPDNYRYSPVRSKNYLGSLKSRRSQERLSLLREKNLSPKRYSPAKSHTHHSPSSRRRRRSLSKDTDKTSRLLSPLKKRRSRSPIQSKSRSPIRSKSRSPKSRKLFGKQSSSLLKKSRPVSPAYRSKDTKLLDNEHLITKEKIKLIDKDAEIKLLDPVLEARKRKFESNKSIEPTSKKIILKKSNSVQVPIQTEKVVPEITNKVLQVPKKFNSPQMHQALNNFSIKIKNDSKSDVTCRIVKLNSISGKTIKQPRPRIVFGQEKIIKQQMGKGTFKLSSAPEEVKEQDSIEEEDVSQGNEYLEEYEKVEETSDSCIEITDEEEEGEINHEVQKVVAKKKELVKEDKQSSSSVDLRIELKRRRALRMNTVQIEVKNKPSTFYPARILQSAIRSVVSSSSLEGKHRNNTELSENDNTEVYYKLKNCPIRLQTTSVIKNEELRKKKKYNVNVINFNQM
ncbi:cyclin-dependent kinase 12-like isoform X2 [Adelges cooleyi]|uniref:cyclin-dependent kinase 12-like isoform X2 n=1 Tax=Adelges cooleyi TaxID=133065 RepID=UPI0021803CF2|nr:cyclin-dependent kinase 12-like isoform X2 [Adelges cooleyi]